jgi:hypothetical protein
MQMNSKLTKKAAEVKREYFRKWRAANKDKVAAQNKRYWEKKAAEKNSEEDSSLE